MHTVNQNDFKSRRQEGTTKKTLKFNAKLTSFYCYVQSASIYIIHLTPSSVSVLLVILLPYNTALLQLLGIFPSLPPMEVVLLPSQGEMKY